MPSAIQQQLNIYVQMAWGENKACIILYLKFDDKNYHFTFQISYISIAE